MVAAAVVLALALGGGGPHAPHAHRPPAAPAVAPSAPQPSAPGATLAIGLTEANADLLAGAEPVSALGGPQSPFALWRDALTALHPQYVRLVLDWAALQPVAGAPPQLAVADDGCMRGTPPCAAFAGVRDVLRAIAAQQRAHGGFEPVIVIDGAPSWAARPPSGCERSGTTAISRPLRPAALAAYRALIGSLLVLGRQQGVTLRWWSPWNEPNHPFFISPQRATCATASPSISPAAYAELARAMAGELRADPQPHRLLLGELAGFTASSARATSISEFLAGLPGDVVCLGDTWSVHAYARRGAAAGAAGPVGELESALDRRGGCAAHAHVWVTETGAGAPHAGGRRPPGTADERAGCRALATQLLRWYRDPRVAAAFQYTFREDPLFPVGLADAGLTHLYPAYYLLRAWAGTRSPSGPPPALPAQCA